MPSVDNRESLVKIKEMLAKRSDFIITTYSGLDVEKMTDLRAKVRGKQAQLKVIKNNLFRIALQESEVHKKDAEKFIPQLKGPLAVTFMDTDFPVIGKLLVDYGKNNKVVEIRSGFTEGKFLSKSEVTDMAGLPSKEELLTIIARGLNTPAQKIATGMNEIISKLARAVKAVGEKNGG